MPAAPAPRLLEEFAQAFDQLFTRLNQREGFRRYLEGLLLPAERKKTLTALANTALKGGTQEVQAQSLQWFLSESNWDEDTLNQRRRELLVQAPTTAPNSEGVLVIHESGHVKKHESGHVKKGTRTAHVGRQYLSSMGKIAYGVVSVSSLWADERTFYPLDVIPYTPPDWFAHGQSDPAYRTKPTIALELVKQATAWQWPFKAVVANSFYGDDDMVREGLQQMGVGYVMALGLYHNWRHSVSELGSLQDVARATLWKAADPGGAWAPIDRVFRNGFVERWWALEIQAGPFGPGRRERAFVVTTNRLTLPELATWYLVSNLPAVDQPGSNSMPQVGASLPEIVRLYGLLDWVEQSYQQVETILGWAQFEVRRSRAIRRHWLLVFCAFTFCWWQASQHRAERLSAQHPARQRSSTGLPVPLPGQKKPEPPPGLSRPPLTGARLARTSQFAQALVAGVLEAAPTCSTPMLT